MSTPRCPKCRGMMKKNGPASPLGAWQTTGIPMRYGTGVDWDEFHTPTEYHGAPD